MNPKASAYVPRGAATHPNGERPRNERNGRYERSHIRHEALNDTRSRVPDRAKSPPPRRARSPPPDRAKSPRARSPPPDRARSPPPNWARSPPPPRRARSPPPKSAEDRRVEAYGEFTSALGGACECSLNPEHSSPEELAAETKRALEAMEGYRALTGEYPYDESYVYCPPAFVRYLRREGLKPEAYDDVPRLVTAAISTAAPYWGALRRALCDSARDWACQELFLERVGSARALAEAAELGWADSRLTHAVVTLQRLVRFRRAAPPGRLDLAAFERLHHVRDPSWAAAHIHLASFAETDLRFEDRDEMAEVSFVRWNRRCIPGFIFAFSRFEDRGSRPHTFELSLIHI